MAAARPTPSRLSAALRREKDPKAALRLFRVSDADEQPVRYPLKAYDIVITRLARAKMFPEMESVLQKLRDETNFSPKEPMFCYVITSYGRARLPNPAVRTFESIPSFRCRRTVKSFNTLLNALLKCEEYGKMMDFFHEIGHPDECTFNVLINACGAAGRLDDAYKLFDEMPRRGVYPNVVTFGTLIYRLCASDRFDEAFELKDDMVRTHGILPNGHIYSCLIKAACKVGDLSEAYKLKDEMVGNRVELDTAVYNSLISALYKAGRKDEVLALLEEMLQEKGCQPDTFTYNTMISALCEEKDFEAALVVLDEMAVNGSKPDVISFNVIICSLCKEGKLEKASDLFEDMPRRGCRPNVVSYRVLFDGLSRHQHTEEAVAFLDEMLFQGYAPRASSLNELVDNLCEEGNHGLLEKLLTSVGKGGLIESDSWSRVVSHVCADETVSCSKTIDHLTVCKPQL